MTARVVAPAQAINYVILTVRMLLAIVIYFFRSLWLGATLAKLQESPSDKSGVAVTQPPIGRPSVGNAEARHLVLSMVDRGEIEARALPNSAVQFANPHSTDHHSAVRVLIPAESRSSEYASLAALASAPSSSLPNAVNSKGAGHANASSPASGNKTLVYQLGALKFAVNGLPNNFSVSSVGTT